MTRLGAALLAVTAACLAAGCRESTPSVTAVRIEARFGQVISQLRFELRVGAATLAQATRPDAPTLLSSPQDLVVYLPDARAGADAVCAVVGVMAAGTSIAGTGQVRIERRRV